MKIQNNGEKFQLTYNGHDVFVPEGISNEFPDEVAYHVQFVANKWGKDIKLITNLDELAEATKEVKAKQAEKELEEKTQPLDSVNLKEEKKTNKKEAKKESKTK